MKKFFGLIVIAIMLFTVTEVTAKEPKRSYVIIAPSNFNMMLAKYTVAKLNLDTLAEANSSAGDSSITIMLVFNTDNFLITSQKGTKEKVIVASAEMQVIPEKRVTVPVADVVVGLLNTQVNKDKFVNDVKDMINILTDRYIKEIVNKVHK